MKFAIAILAVVGCASAQFGNYRGFQNQRPFTQTQRPQYQPQPQPPQYQPIQPQYNPSGPPIAIRSQQSDASPDGSYNWSYETENGISASETGSPKSTAEGPAETVRGRYSYTAPDGTPITVEYYADETGFHAEGAHIPTPPPIPEAIRRALEVLPQTREEPTYQQPQQQQYNRPTYNQGAPFRRF
ncbi:endocuticle structural glycoprotein SgAbd-2-like [Venturia canescens]|uniref:endocuticle structural glycoprotein SgAbd-2-like n=1 Tax=Venturia canescens TaxID=32260 RepID=UPI001C9D5062|nr:endocuticle structural glycoprotein SgAbd-2-like [Venturia canescens]